MSQNHEVGQGKRNDRRNLAKNLKWSVGLSLLGLFTVGGLETLSLAQGTPAREAKFYTSAPEAQFNDGSEGFVWGGPAGPSLEDRAIRQPRESYWAGTGLQMTHLQALLSDQLCETSVQSYLACFEALSALSQAVHSGSQWVARTVLEATPAQNPAQATQAPLETERTWSENGEFRWVQVRPSRLPNPSGLTGRQQWRQNQMRLQSAVQQRFQEAGAQAFSFDTARAQLLRAIPAAIDRPRLAADVINAYLSAFYDPHTYLSPSEYDAQSRSSSDDSYVGIGVRFKARLSSTATPEARGVDVDQVMEGGPAAQAGVFVYDHILEIDGANVSSSSLQEIQRRVRGPAGSRFRLKVQRGSGNVELTLTRGAVVVPNLTSRLLSYGGGSVGLIKFKSFMESASCDRIRTMVQGLEAQGAKALILDLRSNGGGLVSVAICLGSSFVGPGQVIARVRNLSDQAEAQLIGRETRISTLPLVTLIDSGSASASEILAGALQDHHRGWILGERSFGKATVQSPRPWVISGITLWQTIQRFYQPSGRTNQRVGIVPDFFSPSRLVAGSTPNLNATSGDDESTGLREEDLYSNALSAQSTPWVQTRPEAVARMRTCVNSRSSRIADTLDREDRTQFGSDYRLLMGYETALCAGEEAKLH